MKFGINRWYFPEGKPIRECLQETRNAGLDSLEVNIADEGDITSGTSDADLNGYLALAREIGVAMPSLSTGLGWKYPLTSPDEAVRGQGIQRVRGQLEVAHKLGMDAVLVVPGVVNAEISYDAAYSRAQDALKQLAPYAAELKVHIGVENVWNKFLLSPLEFARFVDEIDSPFVGAYFDVGNVLQFGFPDQWIRILGSRIRRIHVKDFTTAVGNITGFCHPAYGDVPWESVKAALHEVGYDGYVTAEVSPPRHRSDLALKNLNDTLRALLA